MQEPSIDAILRGLTDRPNVESTLILSRKDGSIIKTSGFAAIERRGRAQSTVPLQPTEGVPQVREESTKDEETSVEQKRTMPAEELAASIFHFMKAASALGMTLTTVVEEQHIEDGNSLRSSETAVNGGDMDGNTEEGEMRRGESQVQLLRLRIKHREIIIFPDPRYLCCVVQRVGKQAGGSSR